MKCEHLIDYTCAKVQSCCFTVPVEANCTYKTLEYLKIWKFPFGFGRVKKSTEKLTDRP